MATSTVQVKTQAIAAFMDRVNELQGRSQNRLSSGNKWASPSDDPVGVGLVEKMAAQSKRLDAAQINAQNAISLTQAADGFLGSISTLITRMSELAQYAKDPSKNASDNALYQTEFSELQEQLRNTIGGSTAEIGGTAVTKPLGTFNGNVLFGANASGLSFALGKDASETMVIPQMNLRTGGMAAVIGQDASNNFTLSVTDPTAISQLNAAVDQIADARATLGAAQSRLEIASSRITKESENIEGSISELRDTDIASETTRLARYNVLAETSTNMLSRAAKAPEAILQLLRQS